MFSFLRQLTTWHCSQLLLSAGRAATDRYLLPAGPTAANPPHAATAVDRWVRQTDRQTPYRYIDPAAYYAGSTNSPAYVVVQNTTSKLTAPRNAIIHCSVIRSNDARQGKASGNCRNAMTIKRLRFPTIGRPGFSAIVSAKWRRAVPPCAVTGDIALLKVGCRVKLIDVNKKPAYPISELSMGWVDPRVGSRFFSFCWVWFGLGPL